MLPQVQVTSVVTYSGWMSFFMVPLGVTAAGSPLDDEGVNRSQRPSVPSTPARERIGLAQRSTPRAVALFPSGRGSRSTAYGEPGQRVRASTAETREASSRGLNGLTM